MSEAARTLMLDRTQAAAELNTSVSFFEQLVCKGIAPKGRQLGKRCVRWLRSEIEEFAHNLPVSDLAPPVGSGHGRAGKPKLDGE